MTFTVSLEHWPQIMWLTLMLAGFLAFCAGRPRKVDVVVQMLGLMLSLWILYMGGFFG